MSNEGNNVYKGKNLSEINVDKLSIFFNFFKAIYLDTVQSDFVYFAKY